MWNLPLGRVELFCIQSMAAIAKFHYSLCLTQHAQSSTMFQVIAVFAPLLRLQPDALEMSSTSTPADCIPLPLDLLAISEAGLNQIKG